jgi:ribosomal protein L29
MDRRNSVLDDDGGKVATTPMTMTKLKKEEAEEPVDKSSSTDTSECSYEEKLRAMSDSELVQELNTLKWHYALFKDEKRHEMVSLVETEIRRRRAGITKQAKSS